VGVKQLKAGDVQPVKSYSTDLLNLLQSGVPVYKVHLFAIGPCLNGAFIYATDGSNAITYGGNTYEPVIYGRWSRDTVSVKIGLDSNSSRLTVFADNKIPIYFPRVGGFTNTLLLDGIKFGLFGAAPVTIYCAYMTTYGKVVGPTSGSLVETKFVGKVAPIEYIGMTKAVITIQDLLYILNTQVPARLIQSSCSHVLYDQVCTLNQGSFTRTGAIATLPTTYKFTTTAHLTPITAAGTFSLGRLLWTSGQNVGLINFVRLWTPGGSSDTVQLDVAPVFPLAFGDAFQLSQGCDKTFTSCLDFQGNTNAYINFGGQPTVPVPEAAI